MIVQLVSEPLLVVQLPTGLPPVPAVYAEAVYLVMAAPFSAAGVQVTLTPPGVPETATFPGALGTVRGAARTRHEGPEIPWELCATTST